jgi:hypothetical protein
MDSGHVIAGHGAEAVVAIRNVSASAVRRGDGGASRRRFEAAVSGVAKGSQTVWV